MINNHEFEDRVMLTKEQYFNIVSYFLRHRTEKPFITQTNTYFDTDDKTLLNNHYVLRIRTIYGSNTELTLKIKGQNCDEEFNEIINAHQKEAFIKNKIFPDPTYDSKLALIGVIPLSLKEIASITTKRLEIEEGEDLIVIDENRYLDIVDYNLEVESSSKEKAHIKIMELVDQFKLEYSLKYISKSRRAIQAYEEKNKAN